MKPEKKLLGYAVGGTGALTVALGLLSFIAVNWASIPGHVKLALGFGLSTLLFVVLGVAHRRGPSWIRDWKLALALALPVLGLLALMIREETRVQTGEEWRVRIAAYDPRYLLSGHDLLYRFEWSEGGNDGWNAGCLCLGRNAGSTTYPLVRQTECDATKGCDAFIRKSEIPSPGKFFIPEERAKILKEALDRKEADLALMIHQDGSFAVTQMYIRGEPQGKTRGMQ